jgi:acetyl-CoA carboxylase carboxyl transferase subunit beta
VREKLPEGFQRAEYLLEHGILDMVVKRGEMRATLARLIGLLRVPEAAAEAAAEPEAEAPPALPPPAPVLAEKPAPAA